MNRWVVPLFILLLLELTGCAPVLGVSAIGRAELAIEAATLAGSREHAPYEYTAAKLYYDKAREKQNRSQFGMARNYAQKAQSFAQKARVMAEERSGESKVNVPTGSSPAVNDGAHGSGQAGAFFRDVDGGGMAPVTPGRTDGTD